MNSLDKILGELNNSINLDTADFDLPDSDKLDRLLEVEVPEMGKPKPKKKKAETAKELKEELSEVLRKFKEQAKQEQEVYLENVDSEYWVAICFQSREQKEEWLKKTGLIEFGDKYLDGLEVAKKMGIDIADMTPPIRRLNIARNWEEFI